MSAAQTLGRQLRDRRTRFIIRSRNAISKLAARFAAGNGELAKLVTQSRPCRIAAVNASFYCS
jgi:hypothetical protein